MVAQSRSDEIYFDMKPIDWTELSRKIKLLIGYTILEMYAIDIRPR